MLARTDWDNREFRRDTKNGLLDALKNPDFLAICLFAALGLLMTISVAFVFPLNDTSNLIALVR
jgi:hypothetical protein